VIFSVPKGELLSSTLNLKMKYHVWDLNSTLFASKVVTFRTKKYELELKLQQMYVEMKDLKSSIIKYGDYLW
jgi:hypothetical protein